MSERRDAVVRRLVNRVVVPGLCEATVPDWLAREVEAGLAAVCWFGGMGLDELKRRFPDVLVLSDEEGGNVTRLEAARGSSFPGNAALGVLDDVTVTQRVGAAIGAMSRVAGINVVLAPVVDVNSEPENPVIGVRSFGDDPGLVARHGVAFVHGVQSAGVAACAKHFPGHGATRTDSHLGLPVVDADRDTFLQRDVAPFAAAVAGGVRCVLTAHVAVPAVDAGPATMSASWMSYLRGDLGFDGVVVSDALDMRAISRGVGRGAGAVNALNAGVDQICIGNPCFPEPYAGETVFAAVCDAITAAVDAGSLEVARLEQAAERIDELDAWLAAAGNSTEPVGHEDLALGLDAARRTVRAVGEVTLHAAPCVVVEQRTEIAAGRLSSPVVAALVARAPATVSVAVRSASAVADIPELASARPLVVVTDGLAGDAVVRTVRGSRPDAVVVNVGPQRMGTTLFDPPVVFALGNGAANAETVADLLLGPRS
jgi:beta-N-acetylhexosaminidase